MTKFHFNHALGYLSPLFCVPQILQGQPNGTNSGTDDVEAIQGISTTPNLFTGTLNVLVPLCSLETLRGPAIDIGLSYQASGIKIEDRETNVGLGWQLTGVGKITRVVKGRPDENGYRATSGDKHSKLIEDSKETLSNEQFNNLSSEKFKFDGEPDVYYYQTPSCSGSFVIDYNGEVCLMPYRDIVVKIPSTRIGILRNHGRIGDQVQIRFRILHTRNKKVFNIQG